MSTNEELLTIISRETKKSVTEMDIVTPTVYKSVFEKHASKHDIELDKEDSMTDEALTKKIDELNTLQDQASKNAQQLSENTDKAITAIKDKDDNVLNEILQETQTLKKELKKLQQAVYKDELTSVFNRRWLHDNFINQDTFSMNGTLVMLDLNYFKIINDTHGHIVGDKILIFLSKRLKQLREPVVRYGGDEFIVLFQPKITEEDVYKEIHNVRENILKKHMKVKAGFFKVSFSFGLQSFKAGDTLSNIIELADKNMYEDKIKIKKRVTGIEVN